MKSILIAVNVMLAILAAGEVIKCINEKEDIRPARASVAKEPARASEKLLPAAAPVQRDPKWMEEQVNVISALNIFSSDRTPEIPTTTKRIAANNTRGEMRLVGTFEMNGTRGAIILQRTNQRNRNFGFDGGFGMGGFGFGGMGFGAGMNSADQNANASQSPEEVSQAQIDEAKQRLAQLQGVLETLQRNNASTDQIASVSRQIEAQNTLLQQLQAIAATHDTHDDGLASVTATDSNNVRQYLKIGESTTDGYMLIDVTRTSATLRRNNDVIELTMQKASENQEAMALAASRASSAQVIVSDTTPTTPSTPATSSNGVRRGRGNGGFGDFGGGDFGGFGEGDFGGGNGGFGGFGGGNGDFGGFGNNNMGGFGGGNGGFGGGNSGFGGGSNNSRTNSMTGGNNRSGMNSASRSSSTMSSASSRGNTSSRTGMNSSSAGRTNTTSTRSNSTGRTGANTGNRTGGANIGRR